jgi:hypothetical protein
MQNKEFQKEVDKMTINMREKLFEYRKELLHQKIWGHTQLYREKMYKKKKELIAQMYEKVKK